MEPSKRAFTLANIALISSAFLGRNASAQSGAILKSAVPIGPKAAAFVKKMGLTYPICQAGIGRAAGPDLAAAVSSAGGLGALGLTWAPDTIVKEQVTRVRQLTKLPFAVNYVLGFEPKTLPTALEAGAPVVQFSWGIPTKEISLVRSFGAKVGVQVCTPDGAKQALALGVDYLICQGIEGGGHVQASSSWRTMLPEILALAGDVPVIVAGGLGDGKQLREAMRHGASGGLFGTRFVASKESPAHDDYKRAIVNATSVDTAMTICFNRGWANATHRVLRNATLELWEAAGSPPIGKRPGEEEIIANMGGTPVQRYSFAPPTNVTTGAHMEMTLYAGQSVDTIHEILSAGDIVRKLWSECVGVKA